MHLIIYPSLFLGCYGIIIPKASHLPFRISKFRLPWSIAQLIDRRVCLAASHRYRVASNTAASHRSTPAASAARSERETNSTARNRQFAQVQGSPLQPPSPLSLSLSASRLRLEGDSRLSPSRRFRYCLGLPHWSHAASFHSSLPFERDHLRLFYFNYKTLSAAALPI